MPMPASTFTLAVGHWHQVTSEIPPALEKGLGDKTDCDKRSKFGAESGERTETGLVSPRESSTSEVLKGSTLQTGRYFVIFTGLFSPCKTSSFPDVINPNLVFQNSMAKLSFRRTQSHAGEVRVIDTVQQAH